jgi:hypothetical protein
MKELAFTREEYAARIARRIRHLSPEDAAAAGEAMCRERELTGGRWPLRILFAEDAYEEELRARGGVPVVPKDT